MPDWLRTAIAPHAAATLDVLAWRIGVALALGVAVAALCRWARRGESITPTFLATLVMLSTLIAMATQVIGDSAARAFSLVGALSVVRFRTVVRDTQDTAFVILSVVVGMAAGSDMVPVALVGLGIIAAASVVLWPRRPADDWRRAESTLKFRAESSEAVQSAAEEALGRSADRVSLAAVVTAKRGASLDLTYRVRLRPGASPSQVVATLCRIDGVSNVELTRVD